jgi:hypothetical protein
MHILLVRVSEARLTASRRLLTHVRRIAPVLVADASNPQRYAAGYLQLLVPDVGRRDTHRNPG